MCIHRRTRRHVPRMPVIAAVIAIAMAIVIAPPAPGLRRAGDGEPRPGKLGHRMDPLTTHLTISQRPQSSLAIPLAETAFRRA